MHRFVASLLRSAVPLALIAVPIGVACEPADDDAQVLRLIDDAINLENEAVEVICDCWNEAGFESRATCLDDQILPSQRRCVEDAYLREADASELYLECLIPLYEEMGDCLDRKLECTDVSPTDACFADFDLGLQECIVVPNSVQRALEDCSPGKGAQNDPAPNSGTGGPAPGDGGEGDSGTGDDGPSDPNDGGEGDSGPSDPNDGGDGDGGEPPAPAPEPGG